jgi:hypothetical protein
MADNLQVEVTGKSKAEVAQEMTRLIFVTLEKKSHFEGVTRSEYLKTVVQCVDALNGVNPS